jgi:hypothetical protein
VTTIPQAWAAAGYPDAVQHVDWSKPMQAHDAVYLAEKHMRALHRPLGDDRQFWGGLADMLNTWACRGARGVTAAREVHDFNTFVAMAYGYLDMVKRGRG